MQKLIATILLVIVYARMVWLAFEQASTEYETFSMLVVGTNFLVLLGASHAAYLAYKATTPAPAYDRGAWRKLQCTRETRNSI